LPPKDHSKTLARYISSENLAEFDFGRFPHHTLQINMPVILNVPTNKNPVDLIQASMEACAYLSIEEEIFESGTCG
jgi:hypothetical protein